MANTTRWVLDVAFTPASFLAADLNSLASGGGALSTSIVTNSTTLDLYCDVSFVVAVGGTTTTTSYLTLYLLPLNQDGTTYGDGYASSTTTQPVGGYTAGSIGVKPGVASASTVTGMFRGVILPPGNFKFALGNNLGVALYTTAAITMKYRTYNENLNV